MSQPSFPEWIPGQLAELLVPGKVVVIEGCVSAGKSKLIGYLAEQCSYIRPFMEIVHRKTLELYLENKERYAFAIQTIFFQERMNVMRQAIQYANEGGCSLVDRGLAGDLAFALLHLKLGNMNDKEYSAYLEIVRESGVLDFPINVFYLDCTSQVAMQRLIQRGDKAEINSYDVDYLQMIIDCHLECLPEGVIRIPWDLPIDQLTDKMCS